MKKFFAYMLAAVAFVGFTACASDDDAEAVQPQSGRTITAVHEMTSRTGLGDTVDGHTSVIWKAGDKVVLYYYDAQLCANQQEYFALHDGKNQEKGLFTSYSKVAAPADDPMEGYCLLYPSSADVVLSCNEYGSGFESIVNVIPATEEGDIPANSNIAVAYNHTGGDFAMKNALAAVKFQVKNYCSEVRISSNNPLAGNALVRYADGVVTTIPYGDDAASKEIVLTYEPLAGFHPGYTYYAMIIPGEHQLKVTLDGTVAKEASAPRTMKRSVIYDLGVIEASAPVSGEWKLGDVVADTETSKGGIVVWVDPDNASRAKIVSMKREMIAWGDKTFGFGLGNADGAVNTKIIAEHEKASTCTILAWTQALGEGWYIPSKNELTDFYDYYNGGHGGDDYPVATPDAITQKEKDQRDAVEKIFKEAGADPINGSGDAIGSAATGNGDSYWSSNEKSGNSADQIFYVRFGKFSNSLTGSKTGTSRYARGMRVVTK